MLCRSVRCLHSERSFWNYYANFAHSRQFCVFSIERKFHSDRRHSVQVQSLFVFLWARNNGWSIFIYYLRQEGCVIVVVCLFVWLSVCLFVSNFAQNFQTDLHEIFREGCHWVVEQLVKFRWRFKSSSEYMDCFFSDSSVLGDTESG